ncbi:MAG: hypothetical protein R3A12_13585 [Ignavibacteria bacterium]
MLVLNPEFRININSEKLTLDGIFNKTDTSDVSIILNDKYIPFYINGSENKILKKADPGYDNSSENMRSYIFQPELINGSNRLESVTAIKPMTVMILPSMISRSVMNFL